MKTIRYAPSQEGMLARNRYGMVGLVLGGAFVPLPIAGGAFGTLSTLDTLAAIRQSVVDFGEDRAWDSINAALAAHNAQMLDMLGTLVERTTDQRRAYGTADAKQMQELDQFGQGDAQKVTAGITVDFPLRRYGDSLQWTRQWMMSNTVAQLAAEVAAIMDADRLNFTRQVKRALLTSTNATFIDKLGQPANTSLTIRALLNADSSGVPIGPNGETFNAATHTHYLATAALIAANLSALILTVQEHYASDTPVVYISSTDEAAVRALTGFVAAVDPRLIQATTVTRPQAGLDMANLYDRMIGYFGAAEIWVKPWMLAGYLFAYVQGQPPPLAMRVSPYAGLDQLQLVAEDERHPLRARTYERQYGIGVWNRTNGAALYTGGGAYVIPTSF
jgi:hypothetical protein